MGVAADLRKLAASFPHVPALRSVRGLVDLAVCARQAGWSAAPGASPKRSLGLSAIAGFAFPGCALDKSSQCSDWGSRPLTEAQREYAALDAAVAPAVYDALALELKDGLLAEAYPNLVSDHRFLVFGGDDRAAAEAIKAKPVVHSFVVTQSWPSHKPPPRLPQAPAAPGGAYVDKAGASRMPLSSVPARAAASLDLGAALSPNKGKVVAALARHPEPWVGLDYNAKRGFVEFSDATVLFVSHGGASSKYRNVWGAGGRSLTWFLADREWGDGRSPIARRLSGPDALPVYLAARGSPKAPFLWVGKVSVAPLGTDALADSTPRNMVTLELSVERHADLLQGGEGFPSLLAAQQGHAGGPAGDGAAAAAAAAEEDAAALAERLAAMVVAGNVLGAMAAAAAAAGTRPARRSVATGIGTLKAALVQGDSATVRAAAAALEKDAENYGIF